MIPFRTLSGGRIDRARPLNFSFDGKRMIAHAGDTLASALIANGVHLVGRSYKYHRPRGLMAAGAEEPNGLVEIDRGHGRITPNLRAIQVEVFEGLVARSQNRWPSLAFDVGGINTLLAPLLPAGFYYKTFMGPRFLGSNAAWAKLYEPLIRRAAGLGKPPRDADADHYASTYAHCDVLVVGAGPAGLAAAHAAAEAGLRVMLVDEQAEPGGWLLSSADAEIAGAPAAQWLAATIADLRRAPNVRLLTRTQAFGYFAQNFVGLVERCTDHLEMWDSSAPRERLWQVRAKEVVLATGAIERPLVFPGNDRPGIMLADAARTYASRYGAIPGRRAVLVTATETGRDAARVLEQAGVEIVATVDVREGASSGCIAATSGRLRVSSVSIEGAGGARRSVPCDLVLMSGGWTPSVHLFSQSRGKVAWSDAVNAYVPGVSVQRERSVGACRGVFGLAAAINDGIAGGAAAASACGRPASPRSIAADADTPDHRGIVGACRMPSRHAAAFVDFQHDVTSKDLELATREGFRSIEHVKRYTTTGMATDQGKTSNLNALAIVAAKRGVPIPEVGLTTFRQPYTPVTFGALAGHSRDDLFDPVRRTPIDGWARAHGAVFENVGLWQRARAFPRAGETLQAAVNRECRTVRTTAGIFDASTLGKIEVVGPDAAEFLERLYVNAWKGLGVGRCRYGILLNEQGFIIDDGVVGRLAADRFHVTTTTGGAARVLHMMEDYAQTEFPGLKVWLTSTTEQWAVIAVQGPTAREIIAPLVEAVDLAEAAFPHMAVRQGRVCGVEARIFRVSFTGEAGFEINVPADFGRAVWDAIVEQGARHGACAYGTDAMHVLRAEKGFIIVGQETDGTMTPDDVGLAWTIGKAKRDFVGKRSLVRPDIVARGRKQLVGLLTANPNVVLEEGAQVTQEATPPAGTRALGHVTSSYWSEALGRSIALAVVADGRTRHGDIVHVPMPGGSLAVTIGPAVFLPSEGVRTHG